MDQLFRHTQYTLTKVFVCCSLLTLLLTTVYHPSVEEIESRIRLRTQKSNEQPPPEDVRMLEYFLFRTTVFIDLSV